MVTVLATLLTDGRRRYALARARLADHHQLAVLQPAKPLHDVVGVARQRPLTPTGAGLAGHHLAVPAT
ncbi:hypothetical protein [Acrocarpospora catenulata]|uniref:hypothetical protein n=1 Tax=Acrocarpospora catenulata TaxID=2836182 RepID=UPI001BD96B24|nr:hypothetical protein [Acrocarpospora catenulata]